MGDIGDGDPQDMPAGVFGVWVGLGADGIVAVARIGGVDGQQRQGAQILARTQWCGLGGIRLGNGGVGEMVGDAVLVDGNQADGAGAGRIAQPRGDARLRQAKAAGAGLFAFDQFAIACAARVVTPDAPFLVLALVDRNDPPAFGFSAENAQHAQGIGADLADQAGLIGVVFGHHLCQARKDAVAFGKGRVILAGDEEDAGLCAFARPFDALCEEVT